MQHPLTNDTMLLIPITSFDGSVLTFDFPALHIGVAEYQEGPTGCTVFSFPDGVDATVDLRGGSYGTFLSNELQYGDGWLHAICFAGGSAYGLEACAGVGAELFAARGYSTKQIALVAGAVIYDFGKRENVIYPDKALGRIALRTARSGSFPLGPHGAGCSANVGKGFDRTDGESAGQGGAFRQVGPTKVAVFTVVNAKGAIVNRQGRVVRGHLDQKTGERYQIQENLEQRRIALEQTPFLQENTTLTLVVTNQKLVGYTLRQMARQVHTSMARAIQPFQTVTDGDVLFAVTTNEVENALLDGMALGVVASELAWDAVLSSFQPG